MKLPKMWGLKLTVIWFIVIFILFGLGLVLELLGFVFAGKLAFYAGATLFFGGFFGFVITLSLSVLASIAWSKE